MMIYKFEGICLGGPNEGKFCESNKMVLNDYRYVTFPSPVPPDFPIPTGVWVHKSIGPTDNYGLFCRLIRRFNELASK